jgi:hypothetical protein
MPRIWLLSNEIASMQGFFSANGLWARLFKKNKT